MKTGHDLRTLVLLAATACTGVLFADEELSLEPEDDSPKVESRDAKARAKDRVTILRESLKRPGLSAEKKETLQLSLLKILEGDAKFDYAVELLGDTTATDRARIAACEYVSDAARVDYGIWGVVHWYNRYVEQEGWGEEKLQRWEKAFWKSAETHVKLDPKSYGAWMRIGKALLFTERWAEAEKAFAAAEALLPHEKTPKEKRTGDEVNAQKRLSVTLFYRINAVFGAGRTNEAHRMINDYFARKLPPFTGRFDDHVQWHLSSTKIFLERRELDAMDMPVYTGAKAFPNPQEVEYTENFTSVKGYDLEVNGLAADDARLRLLDIKFAKRGAPRTPGSGYKVKITVDPKTAAFKDLRDPDVFAKVKAKKRWNPKNKEGKEVREDKSPDEFRDYMEDEAYVLETTASGATIVAKTKQGALWGIVSLIQLWDREKGTIRQAKMRDWPDVEKRGYLGSWWPSCIEFTLFQKMNTVDHQTHPCRDNFFRPVNWWCEKEMARQFKDFGLDLFYGMSWITHAPQIPICYPTTLPYRISVMKKYAAADINIYYPLDDVRYPICPQDDKAYNGMARHIDGKHQTAIYEAVIKEYPNWKFVVCPPWYCGPDGRCGTLNEPRDPYLAQWSKDLDPRIEAYWTGARVKSHNFQPRMNDWVLKSYKRRPYLFQNGVGWHNLLHYTVDDIDWPGMYCKGTLDKVLKAYHLNAHTPSCAPRLSTLADALWNIGAYNAGASTPAGLQQFSGKEMYGLLRPGLGDLTYFDKYEYGAVDGRVALEDREELEKMSLNVETCWSNACAYAKANNLPIYGSYGQGVGYMRKVMSAVRNPPDYAKVYERHITGIRDVALRETSFDVEKGHAFAAPSDLVGGGVELLKRSAPDTEEWTKERGVLYRTLKRLGTGPKRSATTMKFTCDIFPPGGDYAVFLSGTTAGKPANLRLSVNGKKFFEGNPKTGTDPFKTVMKKFKIPEKLLKKENVLMIENLVPGKDVESSEGCYRISYVVVREEGDGGTGPSLELE